jgi:hypothetical protein
LKKKLILKKNNTLKKTCIQVLLLFLGSCNYAQVFSQYDYTNISDSFIKKLHVKTREEVNYRLDKPTKKVDSFDVNGRIENTMYFKYNSDSMTSNTKYYYDEKKILLSVFSDNFLDSSTPSYNAIFEKALQNKANFYYDSSGKLIKVTCTGNENKIIYEKNIQHTPFHESIQSKLYFKTGTAIDIIERRFDEKNNLTSHIDSTIDEAENKLISFSTVFLKNNYSPKGLLTSVNCESAIKSKGYSKRKYSFTIYFFYFENGLIKTIESNAYAFNKHFKYTFY